MSGFECRNCGGHDARSLYDDVKDRFRGFAGAFDYVSCVTCGLVQIEHVPENLGSFYEKYQIHTRDSAVYRLLRKLTIGHGYPERDGSGKVLDIGCGNGAFLLAMVKRGWRAVGYEFDPDYAAQLSKQTGLDMIAGEAALAKRVGEFDLVTFNHSFEHLANPKEFLALAHAALKPGGEIYIWLPNIGGREAALFKDRWFHLDPPRHLSFFTKELLRDALAAHGFTDIEAKDVAMPTGFAGSVSYRLWDKFHPLTWYAAIVPGLLFSRVVPDGNFAITARRA